MTIDPYPFKVGAEYSRKDVFEVIGIPERKGGDWYTGYTSHQDDWFIFCGIGVAGRTGHDYHNRFQGDDLIWFAKEGSRRNHPSIERLLSGIGRVYLFYRENDRDRFTFAGLGTPVAVKDESPVQITWSFSADPIDHAEILPQEITQPEKVIEGARKSVTVNIYERDPNARRKCIEHWGVQCQVCKFDFERTYGDLGKGFIHVHHLKPLNEIGESYALDPVNDLRPVCPNCHAMLHRGSSVLTVEEMQQKIQAISNLPVNCRR